MNLSTLREPLQPFLSSATNILLAEQPIKIDDDLLKEQDSEIIEEQETETIKEQETEIIMEHEVGLTMGQEQMAEEQPNDQMKVEEQCDEPANEVEKEKEQVQEKCDLQEKITLLGKEDASEMADLLDQDDGPKTDDVSEECDIIQKDDDSEMKIDRELNEEGLQQDDTTEEASIVSQNNSVANTIEMVKEDDQLIGGVMSEGCALVNETLYITANESVVNEDAPNHPASTLDQDVSNESVNGLIVDVIESNEPVKNLNDTAAKSVVNRNESKETGVDPVDRNDSIESQLHENDSCDEGATEHDIETDMHVSSPVGKENTDSLNFT